MADAITPGAGKATATTLRISRAKPTEVPAAAEIYSTPLVAFAKLVQMLVQVELEEHPHLRGQLVELLRSLAMQFTHDGAAQANPVAEEVTDA